MALTDIAGVAREGLLAAPSASGFYRGLGYVDSPDWDVASTDPASQPLTRHLDAAPVTEREAIAVEGRTS